MDVTTLAKFREQAAELRRLALELEKACDALETELRVSTVQAGGLPASIKSVVITAIRNGAT